MKTYRIKVYGKVQGVYFRQSTRDFCNQHNIKGQVKNLFDKSVEILAAGSEDDIKRLIDWAKIGPSRASVERITIEEIPDQSFTEFSIVR